MNNTCECIDVKKIGMISSTEMGQQTRVHFVPRLINQTNDLSHEA